MNLQELARIRSNLLKSHQVQLQKLDDAIALLSSLNGRRRTIAITPAPKSTKLPRGSIQGAIRKMLPNVTPGPFTTTSLVKALFNLHGVTTPITSITSALLRLQKEGLVKRGKLRGKSYLWSVVRQEKK